MSVQTKERLFVTKGVVGLKQQKMMLISAQHLFLLGVKYLF